MTTKKDLGAFYSTNIKELFNIVYEDFIKQYDKSKIIYEPCCGNGDIINYLINNDFLNIDISNIKYYDIINQSYKNVIIQDTIINPLDYNNSYIITNPPFLAKNKMIKEMKDKYKDLKNCNDLFELYILQLLNCECLGGILILPSNFLFSYSNKLRQQFIKKYEIKTLKIYEKQIFKDTTSSVIVFDFFLRSNNNFNINAYLLSKDKTENFIIELSQNNNFSYGEEIYKEKYKSELNIIRFTDEKLIKDDYYLSNIEIKTLDPKIKAEFIKSPKINKLSDRSKINFVINYKLKENEELYVIKKFNKTLNKYRIKYHSLFMSSYREFNRKRLNFDLIYIMLKNIINEIIFIFNGDEINNRIIKKLCQISNYSSFNQIYKYLNDVLSQININHFLNYYDNENYIIKYKNYYENNIFLAQTYKTFEEFKAYIFKHIEDPIIQSIFIKKVSRQSIHEIIQIFLIEQQLKIRFKTHIKDKLNKTKTFDGVNHKNKIYLCCKYIKDCGGSQDNQINDLLMFNKYSYETDYLIYLIVFGDYGINKLKSINPKLNKNVKIIYLE